MKKRLSALPLSAPVDLPGVRLGLRSVAGVLAAASLLFAPAGAPLRAADEDAPSAVSASARGEAAYHFALAQLFAGEGRMEDADDSFRSAVEIDPEAPYLRLSYADFLYGAGAIEEASEQLAAALEKIPADIEALRLAARVELAQVEQTPESLARAIGALERIGELDPNDLDSRLALGRLYVETERFGEAVEVFEGLLDVVPSNGRIRTLLVDSLMRAPAESGAAEKLGTLLKGAPDFLPARLALAQLYADEGDFQRVVDLLRAAPEVQRFNDEVMSRLAGALYQTAEIAEANAVLDELLRIEPGHPSGNFFRTLVYQAEGRFEEAEEVVRALLENNPGEVQLIQMLISSLEGQEDWEGLTAFLTAEADRSAAAGEVERARAFRMSNIVAQARGERWAEVLVLVADMEVDLPGDLDLGLVRSEALHRLGRTDDALELLDELAADPDIERDLAVRRMQYLVESDRKEAVDRIAQERLATGEVEDLRVVAEAYQRAEEYGAAVPHLEDLVERDDAIDILFWLAAAYERVGEHDKSVAAFRKLLEERPDFSPALNYLGYMWAERGENLDEALELIERAVRADPSNGAYVDSMGWVLYQLERYEEAATLLERASRLARGDSVVLEHLADALMKLGDEAGAKAQYERALELEGENVESVRKKLSEFTP